MSEIEDFRKKKDQYFGGTDDSPLTPEQQKRFTGLEYFPEDSKLQFLLSVDEFSEDEKEVIEIATSTGDSAPHLRWGQLKFEIDGVALALTVYKDVDGGEYFLPFKDATTGDESYATGRYLDLPDTGDGRLVLDFNYAYNPYCAYNPQWSCPIAPAENRLSVPVRAGEKVFPDQLNH